MLISEEYRALNRQMHEENENYGIKGERRAEAVARLLDYRRYLAGPCPTISVLDYGCGKGTLLEGVKGRMNGNMHGIAWVDYDPCIPGLDTPPDPADKVVCTDVLEHIEPECLDDVLQDLRRLTKEVFFCTIATAPAKKFLPDGRNTHLIQQPMRWWAPKMSALFPDWNTMSDRLSNHHQATYLFTATKQRTH